jgi:hypothetical protein
MVRPDEVAEQHPLAVVRDLAQQDVHRLDIPMNDSVSVQDGESFGHRVHDRDHGLRRPGRRHLCHPLGEGASVGEGHDEEGPPVRQFPDVVHPDEMVAVDATQEPGLVDEPASDVGMAGEVLGEDLHRHRGVELGIVREPDCGEPAGAEPALDPQASDGGRGGHAGHHALPVARECR